MRRGNHEFLVRRISGQLRIAIFSLAIIGLIVGTGWFLLSVFLDNRGKRQPIEGNSEILDLMIQLQETGSLNSGNTPLDLDRIHQQIELADRILAMKTDPADRRTAVLKKLDALITREKIRSGIGRSAEHQIAELAQFSSEYRGEDDEIISQRAALGEAVASISRFLSSTPASDVRQANLRTVNEKILALADAAADDPFIAGVLFEWIQMVRNGAWTAEVQSVGEAFVSGFSESNDDGVKQLASQIETDLQRPEIAIVDFLNVLPSEREQAIENFLGQVKVLLDPKDADRSVVLSVLKGANNLLALGRFDEAKNIYQRTKELPLADDKLVQLELEVLERRLKLFDSPFDISALREFDGRAAEFRLPTAKWRLRDTGTTEDIEKAFVASDLSFKPQSDGRVIRINIPLLSTDVRKKMVARIKGLSEESKVRIRIIRRDGNKAADTSEKEKTISEDQRDDIKGEIQELTKKFEDQASEIAKAREKDVMDD